MLHNHISVSISSTLVARSLMKPDLKGGVPVIVASISNQPITFLEIFHILWLQSTKLLKNFKIKLKL